MSLSNTQQYDSIIVGGGIAGASVAYALAKRKIRTLLLEQKEDLALGASGNPCGLIYPLLTKHKSFESDFSLESFRYINRELATIKKEISHGNALPWRKQIFLIPRSDLEKERYLGAITANNLSEDVMIPHLDPFTTVAGFLFPQARAISPRHLTKALVDLSSPYLTIQLHQTYINRSEKESIILQTEACRYECQSLFLCHSNGYLEHEETKWLPIRMVRGQIVSLPECDKMRDLVYSYLFGDYLTRDLGFGSVLGASFDEYKLDDTVRLQETEGFLNSASEFLPKLKGIFEKFKLKAPNLRTRVSFRSQTQDRRPVMGRLPNIKAFREINPYKTGESHAKLPREIPYHNNVFILGGLGSRGLTHAMFSAELIVREALGEKLPINEDLYKEFKPERFLLRSWKRGIPIKL